MSEPALRLQAEELTTERRKRILDAAKQVFARAGFHRTTMQDVAAEAGMSPGNLYRYFPSKDVLVAGLCERDRGDLWQDFAAVREGRRDFMDALQALGRKHFQEESADKAKLCLEIWAEATRNPGVAAMQTEFDRGMIEQFALMFEAAKAHGYVHPSVNSRAVASIVTKLGDGLFVRRATAADFDPERELAEVFTLIGALLRGAVAFPDAASPPESQS